MKKLFIFAVSLLALILPTSVSAFDPVSVPNNKFGIHIFNESDLEDASGLVNSNGGDWGYVTFVITESERDHSRWQGAFDKMRKLHLIPIVRIATQSTEGEWKKPSDDEIDRWVNFFNSLNWVVKNRYIIIGNEPNHAKEWGGEVKPDEYANYLRLFSSRLKNASSDYFVLPAGLDASAPNTWETMSIDRYITKMKDEVPDIFNYIDGWTSHSYPNPDFSSSEGATGKGSVKSYAWEINYLNGLGLTKNLPVFITETGWSNKNLSDDEISQKMRNAYQTIWTDPDIVAVTPFILNYPYPPFDIFSWKNHDGTYKDMYSKIKEIPKTKGQPEQIVSGKILGVFINPFVVVNRALSGTIVAQNTGQSIWAQADITVKDSTNSLEIKTNPYDSVEPNKIVLIRFETNQLNEISTINSLLVLDYKGKTISDPKSTEIAVLAPTEVKKTGFFAKIWGFLKSLFN